MKQKIKKGYMHGITFTEELELVPVTIYPNKKCRKWYEISENYTKSGIALVEIKFVKWIKKPLKNP